MLIETSKFIFNKAKRFFLYFPVIVIFFGYVIGIVTGESLRLSFHYPILSVLIGVVLTLISFFVSRRSLSRLLLLVASVIIGFGNVSCSRVDNENLRIQSQTIPINEEIQVKAVIKEIGYSNGNTNLTIGGLEESFSYFGYAKLKVVGKLKEFTEDDEISLTAVFEIPENYDEFDYVEYLERKEIFLIGEGSDVEKVGNRVGVKNWVGVLRNNIIEKTRKIISEPEASLLLGLTIGYRADFDESFEAALRKTGTTHIIAVSGYNVTLLVAIIVGLSAPLGKRPSSVLGFVFLIFFCFLTGFNIPVVRAALMFFVIWLAKSFGRECSAFLGLSIASLIILLINPFIIWDISFQLSFLSTIGLILGGTFDIFNEYDGFWNFLKDSLLSTLWAFLITLPVIVFNFGSFTILTFFSNLLVLPLVNITTILGIVFIVGVLIHHFVGLGISLLLWPILHLIYKIIDWVSSFPFGIIDLSCNLTQAAMYYILLLFTISFFNARKDLNIRKNG